MKSKELDLIQIEAANIDCMVTALASLMNGTASCFAMTYNGVVSGDTHRERVEQAAEWFDENYERVAGAVHAAVALANVISDAFVDYNVTFSEASVHGGDENDE